MIVKVITKVRDSFFPRVTPLDSELMPLHGRFFHPEKSESQSLLFWELIFVIAERHLREKGRRNITWLLEKAVLASSLLRGFAQWSLRVCARNHYHEFSPDGWKLA